MAEAAEVGDTTAAVSRRPRYGLAIPLGLATVAGAAMFCAFPPLDIGGLAWLATALFFFAITQSPSPRVGTAVGAVYGAAFFGPLLFYITQFGTVPWALVVVLEGGFAALLGHLAARLNGLPRPGLRVMAWAGLWVIFEYLRGHRGALSLTLGNAYYSQWDQAPLLQLASLGGGLLISYFIALLGAGLAVTASVWLPGPWLRPVGWGPKMAREAARALLFCYVAFFAAFFWGSWVYRSAKRATARLPEHAGFRVGYVQASVKRGHVPTRSESEASTEAYFKLTRLLPAGCDLIVWPETAMPLVLDDYPGLRKRLGALARHKGSFLLVGINERAPAGKLYNSLALFGPKERILDRYHKMHLVVFGEYVPWRNKLKFIERFPVRPYDYAPGRRLQVFQAGKMRFGTLICFEALFPGYTRRLCRKGAEFIVVATSDAWASDTYEVAQHSRTAIFRAVEARRYVVRVATHGQSMVVTPLGDRLGLLDIGERGAEHQVVFPLRRLSFYHRWGDWPLMSFCILVWLAALANLYGSKKGER